MGHFGCYGLLLGFVLAPSHRAGAVEVGGKATFQQWATAFAARHDAFVQDWWSAELELGSRTDFVARICSRRDRLNGFYLVQAGPDRWSLEGVLQPTRFGPGTITAGEHVQHLAGCATTTPPRIVPPLRSTADRALFHQAFDSREWEEVAIAIRDHEPRIIVDRGGSYEQGHSTYLHDWERLFEVATRFDEQGKPKLIYENAITPILEGAIAVPTWNTSPTGPRRERQPAIELSGTASGSDFTLHVTVRGDRSVARSPGDRFEVVLCDPRLEGNCVRRIEIAADPREWWRSVPSGSPDPPPRVIGRARDRFDLELPALFARRDEGVTELAITVAYQHVEASSEGPVTVIATSRLLDDDVRSLGRMIQREDGSRYPGVETPENAALTLKREVATAHGDASPRRH